MTLIKPLRPCMWPLMPSTARAAGRSGRRYSVNSRRFSARFDAHAWCCAADQRSGTTLRLGPGPGTTLVWPPQPGMWPQLPCTARAVGRSRRSFAESSQRFAARFGARTRGVRTAGTDTLTTSGLHDRTDRKVIFLICENRVSNVRHVDAAHGRVSWRRALALARMSSWPLELEIKTQNSCWHFFEISVL